MSDAGDPSEPSEPSEPRQGELNEGERREIALRWSTELSAPASLASAPALGGDAELLDALSAKISDMLTQDPARLRHAFYRLDVEEDRVERILRAPAGSDRPRALARLVLERELRKAISRRG